PLLNRYLWHLIERQIQREDHQVSNVLLNSLDRLNCRFAEITMRKIHFGDFYNLSFRYLQDYVQYYLTVAATVASLQLLESLAVTITFTPFLSEPCDIIDSFIHTFIICS